MSGRGKDFLENWVSMNVTLLDRKGSREQARALAALCVADAADLGITIDDMEPQWGSVEEIIYDAMHVSGDKLEPWKIVAAIRDRRKNDETRF